MTAVGVPSTSLAATDVPTILAGIGKTGTVLGAGVSPQAPLARAVTVAQGVALVRGAYVVIGGAGVSIAAADPVLNRRDLIVVGAGGVPTVVAGTPVSNPADPAVDPATYAILASVYVAAGVTTIGAGAITDRRVFVLGSFTAVNARDAGARGDSTLTGGGTDDTNALNSALGLARVVFVPEGIYRVTSLNVPDGAKVITAGLGRTIFVRGTNGATGVFDARGTAGTQIVVPASVLAGSISVSIGDITGLAAGGYCRLETKRAPWPQVPTDQEMLQIKSITGTGPYTLTFFDRVARDYLIDQQQSVKIVNGATGGTFTLTFGGQTTAPIPYNATNAQLVAALEALSTIGAGNVDAEWGGPLPTVNVLVRFKNSLGGATQPLMTGNNAGLVGAGNSLSITEISPANNVTIRPITPVRVTLHDLDIRYFGTVTSGNGIYIENGVDCLAEHCYVSRWYNAAVAGYYSLRCRVLNTVMVDVQQTAQQSYGVIFVLGSKECVAENCVAIGTRDAFLLSYGCMYNSFISCYQIAGVGTGTGFELGHGTDNRYNKAIGCYSIQNGGAAGFISGNGSFGWDTDNEFIDCTSTDTPGAGFLIYSGSHRNRIVNPTIVRPVGTGITITDANDTVIVGGKQVGGVAGLVATRALRTRMVKRLDFYNVTVGSPVVVNAGCHGTQIDYGLFTCERGATITSANDCTVSAYVDGVYGTGQTGLHVIGTSVRTMILPGSRFTNCASYGVLADDTTDYTIAMMVNAVGNSHGSEDIHLGTGANNISRANFGRYTPVGTL